VKWSVSFWRAKALCESDEECDSEGDCEGVTRRVRGAERGRACVGRDVWGEVCWLRGVG
jgi:hypothetical protein